ncbi:autophagy-related protein 13 [Trichonephila clavipes]|nr:autophagy-related protein 13 [Trichonephila clavipes]
MQCPVNGWITETVNAQRYLTLLRETVVPCLIQRGQISNVTFMQDGATSHTANPVKAFLIQTFGEDRIVSRRCRHPWSPRSPDLAPANFWLWGYLKSRVYLSGPSSVSGLKEEVSSIHTPSRHVALYTVAGFVTRLECLLPCGGGHVEHILVQELGEHYIKSKIGQVLTPVGTLKVSILYRSKENLTITPQEVDKGNLFMLKSDYFKPDINSKISHSDGYKYEENSAGPNAIGDFQKIGAFALPNNLQDITFPELDMLEKPFLNLSRSKLHHTNKLKDDSNKNADKNANMDQVDNKENSSGVDYNCNSNDECCQQKTFHELFDSGDFLLMETKPPFADYDGDNDIGAFFRECQSAPPLASFSVQPTLEEQVTDIASQLAKFETSMNDFDNFVDSICHLDIAK